MLLRKPFGDCASTSLVLPCIVGRCRWPKTSDGEISKARGHLWRFSGQQANRDVFGRSRHGFAERWAGFLLPGLFPTPQLWYYVLTFSACAVLLEFI